MKVVLFVCVGNACRSQMAEGFFNHLVSGKARAISAGTMPAFRVAPRTVEVMREVGIDISDRKPNRLTPEMVEQADIVITMGCDVEEYPVTPKRSETWDIEDPFGQPIEKFREVRDDIRKRVEELVQKLSLK